MALSTDADYVMDIHNNLYSSIHCISKKRRKHKYSLTRKCINKLWYIQTTEQCSANEETIAIASTRALKNAVLRKKNNKASCRRIKTVWFHLYKVQKYAKPTMHYFQNRYRHSKTMKKRHQLINTKFKIPSIFCW